KVRHHLPSDDDWRDHEVRNLFSFLQLYEHVEQRRAKFRPLATKRTGDEETLEFADLCRDLSAFNNELFRLARRTAAIVRSLDLNEDQSELTGRLVHHAPTVISEDRLVAIAFGSM